MNFYILFIQKGDLLSVYSQHVFLSVSPFSRRSLRRFSAVISPPTTSSSSPAPETRRPQSTKSFTELWLAKKKQTKKKTTNNQGAGPRLPPAPVTVQSIGGMENKRHSTPTLLFCLRLWKKWEGVKGSKGAQSHISGKKQTVFNALRTLVRLELRKCGFLQRTFVFVPFFPFFNKIKPL